MPFAVRHLFHSTHRVPDLGEATRFFLRVFGRKSQTLAEYRGIDVGTVDQGRFTTDYCTFTPIAEVVFECIDPALQLIEGVQTSPTVKEPRLAGLAWFVDGIEDLWWELRRRDMRGTDQRNMEPDGAGPPLDVSSTPIIFTIPEETGLRYEFCPWLPRRDPRGDPPVPAVSASDPLGIERCSHHTILTHQPERSLRLFVDILRGRVIHQARNATLDTDSTYVALADGVLEVAQPVNGSTGTDFLRLEGSNDAYCALTWQVRDLEQVSRHLDAVGVKLLARTEAAIMTDPSDTLGVAWGFTAKLVPGDPRR